MDGEAVSSIPFVSARQVNNLFDKTDIYALAGYTGGANTPLYWTIPGRSYMFTASVSM